MKKTFKAYNDTFEPTVTRLLHVRVWDIAVCYEYLSP